MAEYITIDGGHQLSGSVNVSGAKNSVLKLIAASILIPDEVIITNVPDLQDVHQMCKIIKYLGGSFEFIKQDNSYDHTLIINNKKLNISHAPYELVSKLRASFVVLGPLLARFGKATVSLPGGCQIGTRKTNLHEKGLAKLNAKLTTNHGYIEAEALHPSRKLQANEIYLDIPSNGATENIMMAAVLAEGITIIENAARDPEILDLANFLNTCGAKILGAGSQTITIEGVSLQDLHGIKYRCLPDRVEAATFIIAGLMTKSSITVNNIIPSHIKSLLTKLEEASAIITKDETSITVHNSPDLQATDINATWYPGFPTDMQPQIVAFLTQTTGGSTVKESIYEDRFSHVHELNRMGASIEVNNSVAMIQGPIALSGSTVTGTDLRATAALILAGLVAEGITRVYGLEHLDRGYDDFAGKLRKLGAHIDRL